MSIRKILNTLWFLMTLQTTFIICSSGHKQKHGVEASRAKIQQIYENLDFDLDLKLLFMVTEAYYESGLRKGWVEIQQMYENLKLDLHMKLLFMVTGAYYESGLYEGLGENTANV